MKINFEDISNKVGVIVNRDYPSTTAQDVTNYGYIASLPFPYEVLSIIEKHSVAGSADPLLDVLKVPNGIALSSGTSILTTPFDLTSTADIAVYKNGLELTNERHFDPLDSIAFELSGTATDLEGVQVTIYIKPLNRGEFK